MRRCVFFLALRRFAANVARRSSRPRRRAGQGQGQGSCKVQGQVQGVVDSSDEDSDEIVLSSDDDSDSDAETPKKKKRRKSDSDDDSEEDSDIEIEEVEEEEMTEEETKEKLKEKKEAVSCMVVWVWTELIVFDAPAQGRQEEQGGAEEDYRWVRLLAVGLRDRDLRLRRPRSSCTAAVTKIEKKMGRLQKEKNGRCALARNVYSRSALREDFRTGLRQLDDEVRPVSFLLRIVLTLHPQMAEKTQGASWNPEVAQRDYDVSPVALLVSCGTQTCSFASCSAARLLRFGSRIRQGASLSLVLEC